MKLVVGVVAASWTVGLVGGGLAWGNSRSAGDSMLVAAVMLIAIANIALFVAVIALGLVGRRQRNLELARESAGSMFRRHARFFWPSVILLSTSVLALSGVFGTSHAVNVLLINIAMHVIGIWSVLLHVERIQQRELVHA